MRRILSFFMLLPIALTLLDARAEPPIVAGIPDLVSASDLIIVGQFVPLEADIQSNPAKIIFTISPDRVLKGNLPNSAGAIVASALATQGKPIQSYGIFFLTRTQNGQYAEAVPGFSSIFSLKKIEAMASDEDPLVAVTKEQIAVLSASASELAAIPEAPGTFPQHTAVERAEVRYLSASQQIGTVPVAISRSYLETIANSNPDNLSRSWAIITLIDLGTPVSFEPVISFLQATSADTEWTRKALVSKIHSYGGTYRLPPAAAVSLVGLLSANDVEVRRAAAHGLALFKNDVSTRALAQVALSDSDQQVRVYAEDGLCAAARLQLAPCGIPAEQNETEQRGYWLRWAKARYP